MAGIHFIELFLLFGMELDSSEFSWSKDEESENLLLRMYGPLEQKTFYCQEYNLFMLEQTVEKL